MNLAGNKSRYLDVTLPIGQGLKARIVEKPGLWLEESDLARLTQDIRSIALTTLDAKELTYGVFAPSSGQLGRSIITLVFQGADSRPVAFNALPVIEIPWRDSVREILHLGLVMVTPEMRGRNLTAILYGLACILTFLRNQMRPIWISSVTQVPAVYGMVAETYSAVFPGQLERPTYEQTLIVRRIMSDHRHVFGVGAEARFDEASFVIRDAYTGGSDNLKKTYESAPKHRKAIYNEICARDLDYDRGDDFIQIGRIDLNAARKYLMRIVPRRSIAGIAVALALVALHRFVLPVLHWFDSRRQWGDLRPWGY
jgi:hypothetical protein